jgi:hypothetical protein
MYRELSWFIDCPRDNSIDWNSDNAWAAGEGIINVEVNATIIEQSINHDNPLCTSNYYFYFIEGNKTF